MRKNCARLWLAAAVLCFCRNGWGQGPEVESFQGEVRSDFGAILRAEVELTDMENRCTFAPAEVEADGRFEFRHVPLGDYRITVWEGGQPVYDGFVSVQESAPPITLAVESHPTARPPAGPVSVNQLLHPPARKAIAAFVSARKLADAGEHEKAAEELEKAVRISPAFAEAYINLAVQHIHMGRYQQALEELSRAGEISQPTAPVLVGMAWVQSILDRRDDAIHSARQALQVDPSSAPAHYLLGSLLAGNRATLPEAVGHLRQAARTMPAARENLERAQRELARTATHP
jgi:tetratricopeptide (TPR) repeat protein